MDGQWTHTSTYASAGKSLNGALDTQELVVYMVCEWTHNERERGVRSRGFEPYMGDGGSLHGSRDGGGQSYWSEPNTGGEAYWSWWLLPIGRGDYCLLVGAIGKRTVRSVSDTLMGKWAYTKRILYRKPLVTPVIRFSMCEHTCEQQATQAWTQTYM